MLFAVISTCALADGFVMSQVLRSGIDAHKFIPAAFDINVRKLFLLAEGKEGCRQ